MIPELGHYALILAICLAFLQSIFPLIGASYGRLAWMSLARPAAFGQLFFIAFAFITLAYGFITNDFSIVYVAQNSNSHLPLMYRFCAIWGAHEGSLLLWTFILAIWMSAVAAFSSRLPLETIARVLSVLAMISFGFLLFMLKTSDPFLRYLPTFPADGHDLNPLLQDFGLAIHPPMLYAGYVGFSVAFAFAIAALIGGRLDSTWARWSKPWTLVAWCFLTFGIVLGSWWAYRELGWGGWWFWDPVENASFMPWLAGTALIHSLSVVEKRGAFKAWAALLAICTFSLSLIGTFLVRSGVLVSVHAFAVDPQRGMFMFVFLVIVIGASLSLYALRAHHVRGLAAFDLGSRETMLLSNNILLTVAMATILLGTLYPLAIDSLGFEKISVGAPYFNLVFTPLMTVLLFFMGAAPAFRWRQTQIKVIVKKLWLTLLCAIILAFLLPWLIMQQLKASVILGLALAFWIILATLQDLFIRKENSIRLRTITSAYIGMIIAHMGVAVCVMGIVLTSAYSVQRELRMQPGDHASAGPYQFRFLGTRSITGSNYNGAQAGILVSKNNKVFELLKPEERVYTVSQTAQAKTAIDMGLFRDLYVALGEPLSNNSWSIRIYYKPFVRWIWGGGLLMILGGIFALSDPRYRLKKNLASIDNTDLKNKQEF